MDSKSVPRQKMFHSYVPRHVLATGRRIYLVDPGETEEVSTSVTSSDSVAANFVNWNVHLISLGAVVLFWISGQRLARNGGFLDGFQARPRFDRNLLFTKAKTRRVFAPRSRSSKAYIHVHNNATRRVTCDNCGGRLSDRCCVFQT